MQVIQDRTAFITGGASGIGLAIAQAFVEAGMQVVIADLRRDHIDAALAAFEQLGKRDKVHAIEVDVTNRTAMAAAAEETERVFGKLHVLVNNAGVGIQGPFQGITYADWDFGLAVNLGGVVNGLQTFLPKIRAHGEGGHIVNTASLAALVPMPSQFVIYQSAKAAVVTLSECIHAELAKENIGVSVLCPGPVKTNIHQFTRNRPPQFDIGAAFSEAASALDAPVPLPGEIEPSEVAARVLHAVRNAELYIITHGEWKAMAEARHAALIAAMPTQVDPAVIEILQQRRGGSDPS